MHLQASAIREQSGFFGVIDSVFDGRLATNGQQLANSPSLSQLGFAMTQAQYGAEYGARQDMIRAYAGYDKAAASTMLTLQRTQQVCDGISLAVLPLSIAVQGTKVVAAQGLKAGLKCVMKTIAVNAVEMGAGYAAMYGITAALREAGVSEQTIEVGTRVFNLLMLLRAMNKGPFCFVAGTQIVVAPPASAAGEECSSVELEMEDKRVGLRSSYLVGAVALGFAGHVLRARRRKRQQLLARDSILAALGESEDDGNV
jgi:hypothetical protein